MNEQSRKRNPGLPRALTDEQARDVLLYLEAHHWRGAVPAIARKYGVSRSVIDNIKSSRTYRELREDVLHLCSGREAEDGVRMKA